MNLLDLGHRSGRIHRHSRDLPLKKTQIGSGSRHPDGHYTGATVKRLWLLRHAKSSWEDPGLPDPDRPLAPRGWRAAELLAAHLAASDVRPGVVLCSSSLRTRQTLAAILPALGDALEVRIYRRCTAPERQSSWTGSDRCRTGRRRPC